MSRYSRPIEYENWAGKIIRKTDKAIHFRAVCDVTGETVTNWVAISQLSTESKSIVDAAQLYEEIEIDIPTWITKDWSDQ